MNPDQKEFLNLENPPARLTKEQAAWYLGFNLEDIPILTAVGLLRPLGRQVRRNSTKYFAAVELLELRRDVKWLARATDTIGQHWRKANSTRRVRRRSNYVPHGESPEVASWVGAAKL